MKPLGGGHLLRDPRQAFDYLRELPYIDSICCGMQSEDEIDVNLCLISGETPDTDASARIQCNPRTLMIHDWCLGCGKCVERCGQGALHIENGRCVCDQNKCVRCGYCAPVCPDFCIKVI